ncbi:hypothetical protein RXV86_08485 [Alisedimentitalea sp. MJ-SS2]|uniref:hypothetical protein n=1 Tax=Aliisedimentitalea sp. MJ-SS2 TaxID=3049795 RepID=UPI002906BB2C|nr:hypothetical protein [Alisedimentitalea sp. MJ-SS2]MDU8927418.1 hypothetical protein [Alisedimentitalea sp. MJ-SS2]
MTALSAYDRLEATGLWRATPDEQRRDVIVSIGEATLTITDSNDRALAHWSIPAIARANPGHTPAVFHPDGDPGEILELPDNESEMIEAIEKLRLAVERARPHPGRLRMVSLVLTFAAVVALSIFWLPGALLNHTVSVVPEVKRQEIGAALLENIRRVAGRACEIDNAQAPLTRLSTRLPSPSGPSQLIVLRGGVSEAVHLPGNIILLGRALFEDFEEPDVAAGFIIAEHLRASLQDPLRRLLDRAGFAATVRLLTTGALTDDTLQAYTEHLLTATPHPLTDETLLAGFKAWSVRAAPYAYAMDITGETTLGLIEADPFASSPPDPLISDADWLRLQNICGG